MLIGSGQIALKPTGISGLEQIISGKQGLLLAGLAGSTLRFGNYRERRTPRRRVQAFAEWPRRSHIRSNDFALLPVAGKRLSVSQQISRLDIVRSIRSSPDRTELPERIGARSFPGWPVWRSSAASLGMNRAKAATARAGPIIVPRVADANPGGAIHGRFSAGCARARCTISDACRASPAADRVSSQPARRGRNSGRADRRFEIAMAPCSTASALAVETRAPLGRCPSPAGPRQQRGAIASLGLERLVRLGVFDHKLEMKTCLRFRNTHAPLGGAVA